MPRKKSDPNRRVVTVSASSTKQLGDVPTGAAPDDPTAGREDATRAVATSADGGPLRPGESWLRRFLRLLGVDSGCRSWSVVTRIRQRAERDHVNPS